MIGSWLPTCHGECIPFSFYIELCLFLSGFVIENKNVVIKYKHHKWCFQVPLGSLISQDKGMHLKPVGRFWGSEVLCNMFKQKKRQGIGVQLISAQVCKSLGYICRETTNSRRNILHFYCSIFVTWCLSEK